MTAWEKCVAFHGHECGGLTIGYKAAEYAMELKAAFQAKDIQFAVNSPTNQQFVILHKDQLAALEQKHIVEYMEWVDETHRMVRFCTAWSTRREDLDELLADIAAL